MCMYVGEHICRPSLLRNPVIDKIDIIIIIITNPERVVTFSTLLNEAWGKTMIPKVISSGFKQSGIYSTPSIQMQLIMVLMGVAQKSNQMMNKVQNLHLQMLQKTVKCNNE